MQRVACILVAALWATGAATALAQTESPGTPQEEEPGAPTISDEVPEAAASPTTSQDVAPEVPAEAADANSSASTHAAFNRIGNIEIHGHFDLAYERLGYSGQPFESERAALTNYHQFLFLSRDAKDDPFGFHVELIDLTFYEVNYRRRFRKLGLHTQARLGKILIPFGAEPLYHHSYGGLSGGDQRVLPIVWSQLGAAVQARYRRRGVHVTGELYFSRGYARSEADDCVNLQSDLAPSNDVRIGFGARLGVSWGPLSGWYSGYINPLGFGRVLALQALDVGVWKIPGIPILKDTTLGLGVLRSDVSGGGSGEDYYSFANYARLRYYPTEWLYLQYRTGVRYMNNRRGFFKDDTRLDRDDEFTHNVAIVGQYRGAIVSLAHFGNFEERDEQDDDFLRLTVAYVF
jgi:hypothetical protein